MTRQRSSTIVRESLALRARCLDLWDRSSDAPAEYSFIELFSARAWELLLASEGCALSLAQLLRERAVMPRLASEVTSAIATAEARESQRVLAARHVLRLLDQVGFEAKARIVVIKGGVAAGLTSWQPVDLGDVDTLVCAEEGERIWNTMLRHGWRCDAPAEISYLEMMTHGAFPPLQPPGVSLRVDFHHWRGTSNDRGDRGDVHSIQPLGAFRSLDRQVGASAVLALLRHSVIDHPHRRGHLRDVLLIAQYLRELSGAERRELRDVIARERYSVELDEQHARAMAIADGVRLPADSPATKRFVALKYGWVMAGSQSRATHFPAWRQVSLIALERTQIRRMRYAEEMRDALAMSPDSPSMRTAVHHGLLAPRLTWMLRLGYRLGLVVLVGLCGPLLRWRATSRAPSVAVPE